MNKTSFKATMMKYEKRCWISIEDSEVDHKIPFSKDGTTTIDNAQLAHRYCNRHKSDKLE